MAHKSWLGIPPGIVAGVLSIALVGFGTPTAVAAPVVISVSASQAWTDTGINVSGTVKLSGTGRIHVGGQEPDVGPAGSEHLGCIAGPEWFSGVWVAGGYPCWGLVARVDNGTPFFVGDGGRFIVPTGRLFLGINDEVYAFGDNYGSLTVNVSLAPAKPGSPTFEQVRLVGEHIYTWFLMPWKALTSTQKACIQGKWDACMKEPSIQVIVQLGDPTVWKRVLETWFGWIRDALNEDQRRCLQGDAQACSRSLGWEEDVD